MRDIKHLLLICQGCRVPELRGAFLEFTIQLESQITPPRVVLVMVSYHSNSKANLVAKMN